MAKQPADPHIGIGRPANRRTTRPGGVDLHCEILLIDDHPDVIGNPRHTRELRIAAHAWLPGGEGTGIRAGDLIWGVGQRASADDPAWYGLLYHLTRPRALESAIQLLVQERCMAIRLSATTKGATDAD